MKPPGSCGEDLHLVVTKLPNLVVDEKMFGFEKKLPRFRPQKVWLYAKVP